MLSTVDRRLSPVCHTWRPPLYVQRDERDPARRAGLSVADETSVTIFLVRAWLDVSRLGWSKGEK